MVRIHPYKLFRTVIRASLTDQALSLTQTILWRKEEDISALLNITPVDEHTLQGTPLIAAASVGRPDIVWRLLERGFNPNATTEIDNQTALYQAAERGHIQVVEFLSLKTEKDIFTWSTWTPLHVAAISGHALIVKCLLNAEFNQNAQTNAKMTALPENVHGYRLHNYRLLVSLSNWCHQRLLYVGLPKFFDSSASVLAALSFTRMLCTPLKRDLDCKGSAGEYNALKKMASPKYCLHDSDSTEYGVEPTATVEINRTGIEVSFPLRTMPCRTPHLTP